MMSLPAAIVISLGEMIGNRRQAWILYGLMAAMLLMLLPLTVVSEQRGTPMLANAGIERSPTSSQSGGNMEGKEVRFGITDSSLFATITTTFGTGSVNTMHDSLTPLGGVSVLTGMMLQSVFGGKGVGFLNAIVYGLIAVFVAGD
jgi:K+-transporting ATPase ATPase A chain